MCSCAASRPKRSPPAASSSLHHQGKAPPGEVVAVGPGGRDDAGKLIPIDIKVGETVLFGKWSGTEVEIDGKDLLIVKEGDILGVIEKTDTFKTAA